MWYRRGVHNLTDAEVATTRDAYRQMMALNDNRSYQHFADIHGWPDYKCYHTVENNDGPLRTQLFLPWHRAYLITFERGARDRVADFTLPWWDYTRDPGLPPVFSAANDAAGQSNPLRQARINHPEAQPPVRRNTRRRTGLTQITLPTQEQLKSVINDFGDYADFSGQLEDIHDSVHGWVGGDMGTLAFAAFDPIFWSHHCMIDRLWSMWQSKWGNGTMSTQLLNTVLDPFSLTVRQVLSIQDLGYDYAASQTIIGPGG